jgi:DNA-binding transcriptional ArsR family regulator
VTPEENARLDRLERLVGALLSIAVDRHMREFPSLGSARAPKIEHILSDGGLTGREIAGLLGKSPQAVSQNLQRGNS